MTKEQEVLIALLKQAFTGGSVSCEAASDVSWPAVESEARQHAVTLFLLERSDLLKEQLAPEQYQALTKAAYRLVAGNTRAACSQQELVDLLSRGGHRYVILKGEAAAAYYPKPELRALGDVDFLIAPEDRQTVYDTLIDDGFAATHESHTCHEVFRKPGAHLEMHWEIAGIPHGEIGDRVRAFMADVFDERQLSPAGAFFMPADHHHAVVLLLHMQHHMLGEGLGLRHLCDWACFVNSTADKPFWQEKLIPFLETIGLLTYASVMACVCREYLGTAVPAGLPEADPAICAGVMEDVLSAGNFGTKDTLRWSSGKMLSNRGKDGTGRSPIFYLFSNLRSTVYENHPIVKRHKGLYPFYACYRLLRYSWLMLTGKREPMYKALPQVAKRKTIYDELHIFEVKGL